MSIGMLINLMQGGILRVIMLCAPVLGAALIVGLIVAIFQATTSIQEQTLTFVPKLLAIFLTLMLAGNWILTTLKEYIIELFQFQSYLN